MAEAYTKSLDLEDVHVLSSGTVADLHRAENEPRIPHIISLLDEHGVGQFAKARPEQLTQERIDTADVTICMNQIVADECERSYTMPSDTLVWDIDDTGEGQHILQPGDDPFKYTEEIYQDITKRVDTFVQDLRLTPR